MIGDRQLGRSRHNINLLFIQPPFVFIQVENVTYFLTLDNGECVYVYYRYFKVKHGFDTLIFVYDKLKTDKALCSCLVYN